MMPPEQLHPPPMMVVLGGQVARQPVALHPVVLLAGGPLMTRLMPLEHRPPPQLRSASHSPLSQQDLPGQLGHGQGAGAPGGPCRDG